MLFVFAVAVISCTASGTPKGSTIVVNSSEDIVADDGRCTLREALVSANEDATSGEAAGECLAGDGADRIHFAISEREGPGPHRISPTTPLPPVVATVSIDATTELGSAENTTRSPEPFDAKLMIELSGERSTARAGLQLGGDDVSLRGMAINGFAGDAVLIGANRVVVAGNFIGTDLTGTVSKGNASGGVEQFRDGSIDARVGGADPRDRNLISGNGGCGVSPNTRSDRWTIQGNYLGLDASGTEPLPNSTAENCGGISLDNSSGHIVGGASPAESNVISGNASFGLAIVNASETRVIGNYVGVAADGVSPMGNGREGIQLASSPRSRVQQNVIANNGGHGLQVADSDGAVVGGTDGSQGNVVRGNSGHGIWVLASEAVPVLGNISESNGGIALLTGPSTSLQKSEIEYRLEVFDRGAAESLSSDTDMAAFVGDAALELPKESLDIERLLPGTISNEVVVTATPVRPDLSGGFGSTALLDPPVLPDIAVAASLETGSAFGDATLEVLLANLGPGSLDLTSYSDASEVYLDTLVMLLLPPGVSADIESGPISCRSRGPVEGLAAFYFRDSADSSLVTCGLAGTDRALAAETDLGIRMELRGMSGAQGLFTQITAVHHGLSERDYHQLALSCLLPGGLLGECADLSNNVADARLQ